MAVLAALVLPFAATPAVGAAPVVRAQAGPVNCGGQSDAIRIGVSLCVLIDKCAYPLEELLAMLGVELESHAHRDDVVGV